MYDYNFFSDYQKGQEAKHKSFITIVACLCVLSIIAVGMGIFIHIKKGEILDDIESTKAYIDSADIQKRNSAYSQKREMIKMLTEYMEIVDEMNNQINVSYIKNTELLNMIKEALPKEVVLEMLKVNTESLDLSGTATARVPIAEFQHNLKQSIYFKDVMVNVIVIDEGNKKFGFNIKCAMEDVGYEVE